MDLVRRHVVPFFDIGDRHLVVIRADAIHPFLFPGDMDYRDQSLTGGFEAILREIRGGKGYLQGLADDKRLCQREMIERRQLFGTHII